MSVTLLRPAALLLVPLTSWACAFDVPPAVSGQNVLFLETFESGALTAWQDGVDPTRHRVRDDWTVAFSGSRFLEIEYPEGADGGWLTRLLEDRHDSLSVGYAVRFPAAWEGATKLVALYGSHVDNQWSAFGKAGVCPDGTDFFYTAVTTISPGNPGPTRFYTYYPEMSREPNGVTCWGRYGDHGPATYVESEPMSRARWHRIGFWVRLNAPEARDGLQCLWIDGTLVAVWTDLVLRHTDDLALVAAQLTASQSGGAPHTQSVFVDEVVVAQAPPPGYLDAPRVTEAAGPLVCRTG